MPEETKLRNTESVTTYPVPIAHKPFLKMKTKTFIVNLQNYQAALSTR